MAERVYVALDLETTGLSATDDAIIEIGAVRFQGDHVVERFETLVNPRRRIPAFITQMTGISNEDVADAPALAAVAPELLAFVGSDVAAVMAHNANFDIGFLRAAGIQFHRPVYDTLELAGILAPGLPSYSLGELCHTFGITIDAAHHALDDAAASAAVFVELQARARQLPIATLRELLASAERTDWPYTHFFQDALAAVQRQPADVAMPAPPAPPDPPALRTGDLQLGAVSEDEVVACFTLDGPLAQIMGPTYELRDGQVEMARQVMAAFNAGDHLLIEAGTGTGKSLAYLLPAALWSLANHQRVVVATNTIPLQDQLIAKDIPQVQRLLEQAGRPPIQAAQLKGRQNYLCLRRLNLWRSSGALNAREMTVLAKVLVWLPTTTTGDVAEIALNSPAERAIWQRICSDAATCSPERCRHGGPSPLRDFYLEAHAQAEAAHLLVVNHALLLADLATGGRVLPTYAHLVVDETHRLEETATDQLTYRVEWPVVQSVLRRLVADGDLLATLHRAAADRHLSALLELLPEVATRSARTAHRLEIFARSLTRFANEYRSGRSDAGYAHRFALDGSVRSQPQWSQLEVEWDSAGAVLRDLVATLTDLVDRLDRMRWPETEPLAALFQDVRTVTVALGELAQTVDEIVLAPAGHHALRVAWMEATDNNNSNSDVVLAIAPITVSEVLQAGLVNRCRTAIFTGATLRTGSSFRYIRDRLGLWDVKIATVESPFNYKRAALLCLPGDMPLPNQPQYQQAVEQAIVEVATAVEGRTLVLFTSFHQLRTTADAIHDRLERAGVKLLQHGQGSRHRLLRDFRAAPHAVLLGTRTFWEGVDLPGDELQCLLIARLPFAVPDDPLVAARSAEFEEPFYDYTVPDAVLRFRQGFGRLIRRTTDRGVVVILDSRVWRKEYGTAFLEALPECTVSRVPLRKLGIAVYDWLERKVGAR